MFHFLAKRRDASCPKQQTIKHIITKEKVILTDFFCLELKVIAKMMLSKILQIDNATVYKVEDVIINSFHTKFTKKEDILIF